MTRLHHTPIEQLQLDLNVKTRQIAKLEKIVRDCEMKLHALDQRIKHLETKRRPFK